jgi:ribose transport system substrate-binding protein
MTEISSQIAVTEGDAPSSNTRLRITDLMIPDGPPDMLVTGRMGPPLRSEDLLIDYPK